MKTASRLTTFALTTYPSWWRERYHDEMVVVIQSLLDDGRSPLRVTVNLITSSLRTRLVGAGAPASREFWVHRTQRSLLVATLPWFAIVPFALIIFLSNSEYNSFHGTSSLHLSRAGTLARALHGDMFYVIVAYVIIALVGWRRMRHGLDGQDLRTRWSRLVNGAAIMSITLMVSALFLGQYSATAPLAKACAFTGLGLFAICWFSVSAVVAQMLRYGELPVAFLRTEVRLSAALAGLSGVLTLLAVGNCVALSMQPKALPGASYWVYSSSLGVSAVPLLTGFLLLTIVSALGAYAARSSYTRTLNF